MSEAEREGVWTERPDGTLVEDPVEQFIEDMLTRPGVVQEGLHDEHLSRPSSTLNMA